MDTIDIVVFSIVKGFLIVKLHIGVLLLGMIAIGLFILIVKKFTDFLALHITEVEIKPPFLNLVSIKLATNKDVKTIAHKAWVEIMTRKVGLQYDEDNDVIEHVYNSWYDLFKVLREIIKDIPSERLSDKNTRQLVDTLISVLNKGLRPHLTKFQARFKKWYSQALNNPKNSKLSPQEIQRQYPEYRKLIGDLKSINFKILEYASDLNKIF